MSENSSVETQIISNVSMRRKILSRWGPPLFTFAVAAALITKDSSNKPLISSTVFRNLEKRRELYSPYDKSTDLDLPQWTNSLADVWDPISEQDTPFFWYIPKAGGSTITRALSQCLGLVLASNKGTKTENTTLGIYEVGGSVDDLPRSRYVNVKTNSEKWINKCKERGLIESGLTDVFTTQHMSYAAEHLFSETRKGRGFVMMRHPVKRVIDQFFYRQQAASYEADEHMGEAMPLEEFVQSDEFVENFEVRMLNGIMDPHTAVTEEHVKVAKEILRRKFLVGIFEWFDVGVVRFEKYFQWWYDNDVLNNMTINNCHYSVIESGDHVGNYPKVENAEKIYTTIMTRSWADVELYHYAKFLFAEQAKLI